MDPTEPPHAHYKRISHNVDNKNIGKQGPLPQKRRVIVIEKKDTSYIQLAAATMNKA